MIKVMQLGARLVEEAYPDVLRLLKGADLVITSNSTCGIAEAEKLGVPWISVTLQPGRIPLPAAKAGIFQRAAMAQLTRLFVLPHQPLPPQGGRARWSRISPTCSPGGWCCYPSART